jgi:hypothetical protein
MAANGAALAEEALHALFATMWLGAFDPGIAKRMKTLQLPADRAAAMLDEARSMLAKVNLEGYIGVGMILAVQVLMVAAAWGGF